MRIQDQIVEATQAAVDMLFRTANAMPEDKLTWSPLNEGRTALDMLQECAQSPMWAVPMLNGEGMPTITPEMAAQFQEDRKQWKTREDCERACRENCEKLYEVIRSVPDEKLAEMIQLPFTGAPKWPATAIMSLQYWNCTYHTGQINYIQTLYGDKEMH